MRKDNHLYYYSRDAEIGFVSVCDVKTDFGERIDGVFQTKRFHFSLPHTRKLLRGLYFNTMYSEGGGLCVTCFGDGREIFQRKIHNRNFSFRGFSWKGFTFHVKKSLQSVRLKIAPRRVYTVSLSIENPGGVFSVSDLLFEYLTENR